jgi:dipeptidyl aminopeptidase/acylaminoacyl peptidase
LTPLVDSPFNDTAARLAPDGRLLAFTSEQSGRSEVYVQALDGTRGRWQLSSDGGSLPRWRGDGRELFYLGPPDRLMSVTVEPGAGAGGTPQFGSPVELFQKVLADFDPAPDGQSFVELLHSGTGNRPLTLVTHWTTGLQR